ncbi:alpha/beta hydrolase [Yoonia sp. BS5-3]|uniref:Alpha/beta hydrolase n=1 Tax=Yoonia phaeophyticola TaxID=3137369 RepID=A0ABZ2V5P4_9RHOB
MIDPTADTKLFRLARRLPDNRLGLGIMHLNNLAAKWGKLPEDLLVETVYIPRPPEIGKGNIRTLVIKPRQMAGKLPIVVHFHGGGFAIGTPEQNYGRAARYIAERPAIFVMPDYRLSQRHPFPAGLDDCYETLLWARDVAEQIGGRSDQLFVMGESGGGGLVAAVAQMAQDRGEVNIACQFPIYGMFDDRPENFTDCDPANLLWSRGKNILAWDMYLRGRATADCAVPARRASVAGQPPAVGFVGDQDLFLDENIAYFERLAAAGVPTTFKVFEGAYHGVEVIAPQSDSAQAMWAFSLKAFADAVDTYTAAQPNALP